MVIEQLVLGGAAVAFAAGIGGITGFGFALISTPLLLLLGLPLPTVVVLNLACGAATRLMVVIQLRQQLDHLRIRTLVLGAVPGMAVGWFLIDRVDSALLERAVGTAVLVAALALALSRPTGRRFGHSASFGVGSLAGLLGVVGSLNGVPPAVMYAREGGTSVSALADMAAFLVVSSALSAALVVLAHPGNLTPVLVGAVCWLPAALVVTALSTTIALRLPTQTFRTAVIVLVAAGGLTVLLAAV
ncbi:TSUP family transporter [Rhodococcus sp. DMU1]|uniref:TSUP family transporter n=1 Tax=Rhodococcus sp. DMU1 TaxID=2722825 RepID=UPI00143E4217|nr:TSUP family transporter [Rhodococcus sp. DMU1]QIX53577.1 TSUP family transporter [Rhodococcus sp. DMU1]